MGKGARERCKCVVEVNGIKGEKGFAKARCIVEAQRRGGRGLWVAIVA